MPAYQPQYEEMRDDAVLKYKQERKTAWLILFGCALANVCLYLLLLVCLGAQFTFLWRWVCGCIAICWLPATLKNLKKPKQNYLFRLRKAIGELERVNIYMEIPEEDLHRVDNPYEDFLRIKSKK